MSELPDGTAGDGTRLRFVHAAAVRARISWALHDGAGDATLGTVTLRLHQRLAVTRVRRALEDFGGALLADEPGLGKSYVALAIAREFEDVLLVCPASLRGTWLAAMRAAGVSPRLVSQEALSRGARVPAAPLVVVDEAHHCRNPATIRYRALATLTADARVLLLTATPVHNGERDLDALLALFRGRAPATDDVVLARCVVRRTHAGVASGSMPQVLPARALLVAHDDREIAELIAGLPPPLPLEDGGPAGALIAMTLLRQWASSGAALRGGIGRHLARTDAVIAALHADRLPSRRELASWTMGDDAMQLAFPELMAGGGASAADCLPVAVAHREALRALADAVGHSGTDARRAALLRETLRAHAHERVLCFSQFDETIRCYWRELRDMPWICALSSRRARIAGGSLSRREAIERFAPHANGAPPPSPAEEIRVLLTTDMMSEGVNLQDASVVVHLDLPWTPARIAQRVGRAARIGSVHDRVTVYEMRAPATALHLLALERRLGEKATAAAAAVASPDAAQRVTQILECWRRDCIPNLPADALHLAAVSSPTPGWLALVSGAFGTRLVASLRGRRGDAPALVAEACTLASGPDAACPALSARQAIAELREWLASERAAESAGVGNVAAAGGRRAIFARLAAVAAGPRVRRSALDPAAAAAWRAAGAPLSAGREARLRELKAAAAADPDWLRAVGELARGGSDPGGNDTTAPGEPLALIILLA